MTKMTAIFITFYGGFCMWTTKLKDVLRSQAYVVKQFMMKGWCTKNIFPEKRRES